MIQANTKLNRSQQPVLVAKTIIPHFTNCKVASRMREVITPLIWHLWDYILCTASSTLFLFLVHLVSIILSTSHWYSIASPVEPLRCLRRPEEMMYKEEPRKLFGVFSDVKRSIFSAAYTYLMSIEKTDSVQTCTTEGQNIFYLGDSQIPGGNRSLNYLSLQSLQSWSYTYDWQINSRPKDLRH